MSGVPLIAWASQTAIESQEFDAVIVSTDDPSIASIAESHGASAPFIRPKDLADDFASTAAVMAHAIFEMQHRGFDGPLACCIYPAAVFVDPADISAARGLLAKTHCDYVSTVVRYAHPIQRALDLAADSEITVLDPPSAAMRTQDLPPRWHDAGQFYWGRVSAWSSQSFVLASSVGYELRASQVQDIDSEEDWLRAERLHAERLARHGTA